MIEYVRKYPNPNAVDQVPSQGPEDQAPIGVLSFTPDRADVLAKAPLRGTRGGLFRQIMSRLGLSPDVVWKFYVRQRPGALSSDDIEAETREFWKELRWLIESKGLKVVIGLATPELLKFFGISGAPEQVRGSLYEINLSWPGLVTDPEAEPCDVPMIMTYDPEFLISKRWTTGGKGTADNIVNSLLDFEKAIKIGSEGYVRYVENFVIAPSFDQFVAWAEDVLRRQPLIAVDIETDGFSGAPVVIGFATSSSDAFSVPIRRQGGLNYWPASLWTKVKFYVDRILEEVPQIYQNALFDVPRLAKAGFKAKFRMVRHDTMLLHHVVNPEAKHNLGYITSVYGATPFWKEGIFDRGQNILELDERQVWTYNLRDCVVLHQVLPGLLADLKELGPATARVYYDETLPLMRPVHAMTLIGIKFSQARAEAFKERLTAEILELEHKIRKTYGLPDEFNLGSSDHLGILLYGVIPEKFKTAGAQARAREVSDKTNTKIYAELISMERLAEIPRIWAFGKSMFRVPIGQKSGKPGTGSGDRLAMIVAANKRMDFIEGRLDKFEEEANQIQRLLVFMDMFEDYQELTKLMSTYTEFPTWADGRVHGSYLIHGTSTGRLASRKPNMQNFPKRSNIGKEVRKLFVAPRGRVFISADYSNLEARIVGYEANEPEVQKIFAQGLNQHDINTRNLFHLEPGDPKWELARRAAKTFQFGLIQYGGSDREIHRKISIEVPELGLTLRDLQEAKNNYFKANPNLLEWRLKVAAQVQHERKITNAFGRVRLFHSNNRDIIKEAYNFPMQSAAASIINDATIRIFDKLTTNYQETFLIAQIHDQLIFEAPDEPMYLKRLIKMIKTEMERPRQAWGREVSFPVDFESGPSLGELEPLEL